MKIKSAFIGFSLVELLICIIVIGVLFAAFSPVISKKLKNSSVSLSNISKMSDQCGQFGSDCELCTKSECVICSKTCDNGFYKNSPKCACDTCSSKFENCETCSFDACTKCNDDYYISDGKCKECPTGQFCDGINASSSCPSGNYISGKKCLPCTDKYGLNCATCDAASCLTCTSPYFIKNNVCVSCNTYNKLEHCNYCTSEAATSCTDCVGGYYLTGSGSAKTCVACSSTFSKCADCSSASRCGYCTSGYFVNSSGGCSLCSVTNCLTCKEGASSAQCASCLPGYYSNGSACSECSKIDSNCATCSSATTCTSCKQGFYLSEDKKSCIANDTNFTCSDDSFMQIGSLCVTRYNMGDKAVLSIPSSVKVVNVGEYCYVNNNKCCWKGTTATSCNSINGSYSGCNRTVCSLEAAEEICNNFSYGGYNWRLPTHSELSQFQIHSVGLKDNGLMICDFHGTTLVTQCSRLDACKGSLAACEPAMIWGSDKSIEYYTGTLTSPSNATHKYYPGSVRCVADI